MVLIKWTNQAVFDLKEIFDYIGKDSKKYAKIQVQKIKQKTQVLKENPFSGQKIDFFNQSEIRQLAIGSYIIIYKIIDIARVDILSIHHSARDLNKRKLLP